MAEMSNDKGYKLVYNDKSLGEIKLNKSNIVSVYNIIKNPRMRESYNEAFGAPQINNLMDMCTSKDKAF